MIWYTGIAAFILLLYFFLIYNFFLSWKNYPSFNKKEGKPNYISVVVSFYNESENLKYLVEDLVNQTYSSQWLDVILVDDYSNDDSFRVVSEEIKKLKNIRLLKNQYRKGKKFALKTAVEATRGNIILTTDADCRLNKGWIEKFADYFSAYPSTMLLSSGVILKSHPIFTGTFQSLEFASLVSSGAASFIQGSAIMCNGANLAFQKELFIEAFDFMHSEINTGDDMFLMLYAKKKYPGKLAFLKSGQAFTYSRTLPGWVKFLKQRLRWASKSSLYRDSRLIYVASIVLILNFILSSLVVLSFINYYYTFLFVGMIIIKSIPDYKLLKSFLGFCKQDDLLNFFIPSQLINIFFIPVMGILGLLYPVFRKENNGSK